MGEEEEREEGEVSRQAREQVTPPWQWTHTGNEVLLLKCVGADGVSYRGKDKRGEQVEFSPLTVGATIEAPDWDPTDSCGGGIHGWAWGIGIGGGKAPDWQNSRWLVIGCLPSDIIHVAEDGHKDKAHRGTGMPRQIG
jgi:hypothetical protein